MTEPISKEKAKYLKRMERQAKRAAERSARVTNQREAQRVQQARIAEQYGAAPNHFKFNYTEADIQRMKKAQGSQMLPRALRAQAALAAAAATAETPHAHTEQCGHVEPPPIVMEAEASVPLSTQGVVTDAQVTQAMQRLAEDEFSLD